MTSVDAAKLDSEIAARLATAEVVVRGRLRVRATRDAHIGALAVDAILRGAIAADVGFISAPAAWSDAPALYFLQPEGNRYRVIEQGDALGLPLSLERSVIAEIGFGSKLVWARQLDALKAEVDVFRKAKGMAWSPAQQPAVAAARKIFATVDMIGIPSSEIERTLGAPDETLDDGRWRYTRHEGEAGAIFVLRFAADRVSVVEIHRTE